MPVEIIVREVHDDQIIDWTGHSTNLNQVFNDNRGFPVGYCFA
jgi:hypothetical protein